MKTRTKTKIKSEEDKGNELSRLDYDKDKYNIDDYFA